MSTNSADTPTLASVNIRLDGGSYTLQARVDVPTWPIRVGELLPLARALCDGMVGRVVHAVEESGERVSCRAGCGACCRMLVPISEIEARRLRQFVSEMPEPRRSHVLARFAAAIEKLDADGLVSRLRRADEWTGDDFTEMTRLYFESQVACPFLEEESCSIYEERPITCREYLVTSPAEYCARPETETVTRVRIPLRMGTAVTRWEVAPSKHCTDRWVPLTLALEWAEAHPEDPPPRPGTELLNDLMKALQPAKAGQDSSEG